MRADEIACEHGATPSNIDVCIGSDDSTPLFQTEMHDTRMTLVHRRHWSVQSRKRSASSVVSYRRLQEAVRET
jgi:hypothetical protein